MRRAIRRPRHGRSRPRGRRGCAAASATRRARRLDRDDLAQAGRWRRRRTCRRRHRRRRRDRRARARAPLADGVDEQAGGLRTGLEERAHGDTQAAPGDVLVEHGVAGRRRACREAVHVPGLTIPAGGELAGRHRHPQRRLDTGIEAQLRQQRRPGTGGRSGSPARRSRRGCARRGSRPDRQRSARPARSSGSPWRRRHRPARRTARRSRRCGAARRRRCRSARCPLGVDGEVLPTAARHNRLGATGTAASGGPVRPRAR